MTCSWQKLGKLTRLEAAVTPERAVRPRSEREVTRNNATSLHLHWLGDDAACASIAWKIWNIINKIFYIEKMIKLDRNVPERIDRKFERFSLRNWPKEPSLNRKRLYVESLRLNLPCPFGYILLGCLRIVLRPILCVLLMLFEFESFIKVKGGRWKIERFEKVIICSIVDYREIFWEIKIIYA